MRALALLPVFLALHLKVMLQYRADFVMGAVGQIIYTLLSVAFIGAVMMPGTALDGWRFWDVMFLLGFGDVAFGLSAILFFRVFLSFESVYIIQGRLDQLLLQPLPVLPALILRNIDLNHLAVVIKGLVVVAVAAHMLDLAWSAARLAEFALLAASAATIYGGLYIAFVSLGFWFRRRASLARPVLSLNYLTQYPLTIYPGPVQVLLTFVLPLGLATFYPAQSFLGIAATNGVAEVAPWMMPLLALAVAAFGAGVFHLGLRRYVSSGT
ncbi:ABC transporter permease [Blastochloris tepida]|uniref:ABC transporter permease n=1 Tax=Blastochloris tepida TaxID=2233851 RepID=A0A348G1Q0_9HYPH|nr:ABC-2 family transporter protein [Blastochloris tepida]BBF93483.1 ABC transporter permease [Blastochloris tepida]